MVIRRLFARADRVNFGLCPSGVQYIYRLWGILADTECLVKADHECGLCVVDEWLLSIEYRQERGIGALLRAPRQDNLHGA